ncbi:hypothetical protein BOSEA31B_11006 [Hyphomicrobiales bacterium]|nr:hypothetical protein BOSEA31B_11006 [Hyphomicrobiales bacterium]CAH1700856.1 hypothetical protein BOSEA1005_20555 [Hyphomicrobiales bacterium]CAI0344731.1 hypothetical protein BO1005MUT1_350098 [Hyphomicrobiales bacterium]
MQHGHGGSAALRPGRRWPAQRPVDDALGRLLLRDVVFGCEDTPANGDSRRDHGFRISGNERVPPGQVLSFRDEAIGAGRRQPGQAAHLLRRQGHAIGHLLRTVRIVPAAAGTGIEQATADIGREDAPGLLVLELDEAAAATAVAKRLPLLGRHGFERRGAPERLVFRRSRRHGRLMRRPAPRWKGLVPAMRSACRIRAAGGASVTFLTESYSSPAYPAAGRNYVPNIRRVAVAKTDQARQDSEPGAIREAWNGHGVQEGGLENTVEARCARRGLMARRQPVERGAPRRRDL